MRIDRDDLQVLTEPSVGMVSDTLRRVLGLATPPPDVSIDEWMAVCWLEIVIARARRGKRAPKLSWPEVAALHPAIEVMAVSPAELTAAAPEAAAAMRWERLRQAYAAADARASWMDEGMSTRWMVYGRPTLDELLRRAAKRMTADARAAVEATLAGWGLLGRASVA